VVPQRFCRWPRPGVIEMGVEPSVTSDESLDLGPRWSLARRAGDLALSGWVAAAVLTAIAPYRAVFRLQDPRRSGRYARMITGVDGWGRSASALDGHWSGERFGILLWACAASLPAVSTYAVVTRSGSPRYASRRVLDLAAVGATALLAGVVASLVIDAKGFQSWIQAPASKAHLPPVAAPIGGCIWLSLAALGCAGAATIAHLLRRSD
jgi:hypothetical protein